MDKEKKRNNSGNVLLVIGLVAVALFVFSNNGIFTGRAARGSGGPSSNILSARERQGDTGVGIVSRQPTSLGGNQYITSGPYCGCPKGWKTWAGCSTVVLPSGTMECDGMCVRYIQIPGGGVSREKIGCSLNGEGAKCGNGFLEWPETCEEDDDCIGYQYCHLCYCRGLIPGVGIIGD